MKILFDTCIAIDVLQHREPFWQDSYAAFLTVANRQAEGYLTAKSFTDIYYLTHRQTHDAAETRRVLTRLLTIFDLLDTSAADSRRALASAVSDYEDAVMIETAIRSGMDCILTRNVRDYQHAPIPVLTPAALREQLPPVPWGAS